MENLFKKNSIEIKKYYHFYNEVFWKVLKSDESDKARFYYSTKIDIVHEILKNLLFKRVIYKEREMYDLLKQNSIKTGILTAESIMHVRYASYKTASYN